MKKIKQAKVIESDRMAVALLDIGDRKGLSKGVTLSGTNLTGKNKSSKDLEKNIPGGGTTKYKGFKMEKSWRKSKKSRVAGVD